MIHTRKAVSFFPRIVESFAKKSDGKVDHRIWVVMFDSYQFCECKKCKAPSLFIDAHWTKTKTHEEGLKIRNAVTNKGACSEYAAQRSSFPGFSKAPFPAWTHDLEEEQMLLFWEVYTAISLKLCGLAMMGIRSIIDGYANRVIGDIGGFEQKLKKLRSDGHISFVQFEQLKIVVAAGHAAAHRGHRFNEEHLHTCLQIVEGLLAHERYGEALDTLRSATPSRDKQ